MSYLEIIIGGIMFFGSLVIAWQFGRNGFLGVGLQPSTKMMKLVFFEAVVFTVSGFLQKKGYVDFPFLARPKLTTYLVFLGIPFCLMVIVRIFWPSGLLLFNKAKMKTESWMAIHYVPGKKLEIGNNLAKDPMVEKTLKTFNKAITLQEKGTGNSIQKVLDIDQEYGSYYGTNKISCPKCGSRMMIPISGSGNGICERCGTAIAFRINNGKVYVTAFGIRTVTTLNRFNASAAYTEMALLLRMANRLDEAKAALDKSQAIIVSLLDENDGELKKDILMGKSMNLFRLGDIAHVEGKKSEAKRLYEESLSLDKEIGDHTDDELTVRLISEVS